MVRDRNSSMTPPIYRSSAEKLDDIRNRSAGLGNVIRHAISAIDLVELVDELGLGAELKELVGSSDIRRTSVTNACRAAQLDELAEELALEELDELAE